MKENVFAVRTFLVAVLLLVLLAPATVAQATSSNSSRFVLDVNRPYVYLLFDHIGKGDRFFDDEPDTRIWFRFVNNCNVPISLHTFSVENEIGVMHNVVADPQPVRILGEPSPPEVSAASRTARRIPRGYSFDVSSLSVVSPGESLLFSIPATHLVKDWHIEIPYRFELPAGKCCRAENIGGEPHMMLSYSEWYLPQQVRKTIDPRQ